MGTIQLGYILIIFLVIAVCCNCQSDNSSVPSSWAKLQISPDPLSSMKYGNFHIEIYEHANNHKATTIAEKKYFYSPIALLDHKSAVSRLNRFTKQPEMRFRIEMWNDKVENEVVQHVNQIVGQEIQPNKVRVIPLEKIFLTSKRPTPDYSLSPEWTHYDKSKTLRLSLSCFDRKVCDELAEELRSDPEQFHHFKLLYILSSQTSLSKETIISFKSVTSGQMVANLLHKFEDKTEIFLTANDEKKMLMETATKIRKDTFNDFEIETPDTESQIYNILKDLMVTSRTTIKEENDKKWDSVFWNEDNYRPDRTTKTLNEIITKLDTETQKKLADMFQKAQKQSEVIEKLSSSNKIRQEEQLRQGNQTNDANEIKKWELAKNYTDEQNRNTERIQHSYDPNSWADVDRISLVISETMANNSDSYHQSEILKEDVENLLQESRNHVRWDGEKFVPKPMQLSRINLDKFRDSQSFQDRKVGVRYMNAELSVPIKFVEHEELTVTDEWSNLKDELNDTRELLKTTIMNLEKTSTELSNVKSYLTNTTNKLEGTKQELEETKILLEKTRVNLSKNVDDLSTKLNANSQRLVHELKVTEDNMKKELRTIANQLETTTTNLSSTRTEVSSAKSAIADFTTKLNARTSEIVDIGKMPSSCADLQRMGHKLSGFFSVKGSKKMEMIHCDFNLNQNDKQKWIGYADVKSAPVHFYVQRNTTFSSRSTPIPFELAQVNEGNAMNMTTGKFTAPRPGIYFFSFTALLYYPRSMHFGLNLNGNRIGSSLISDLNGYNPLSLQSTLNLKKGDQVWLDIFSMSSGHLHDDSNHFTHFTGILLEEEIVTSL